MTQFEERLRRPNVRSRWRCGDRIVFPVFLAFCNHLATQVPVAR
jgi:hypothetical protein